VRKLIVTVPEEFHRALKMRAAAEDTTIREIVTEVLRKALGIKEGGEKDR
jgi:hypothetical protein